MVDLTPISRTGFDKLKRELEHLQKEELPPVMEAVARARELGDLKENGEYLAGRERQGMIMGQISELKGKLNQSDIVDCTRVDCERAVFGTVVRLLDRNTDKEFVYQLLGPFDADYNTGSISVDSPVGRAILGHAVGDQFTVRIPAGERAFEVLSIEKPKQD